MKGVRPDGVDGVLVDDDDEWMRGKVEYIVDEAGVVERDPLPPPTPLLCCTAA